MAYILGADVGVIDTSEDVERQRANWQKYLEYLESVRDSMPRSSHEFATATWRHEKRSLEIVIRLLGPYHNGRTVLQYRGVQSYSLNTPFDFASPPRDVGHGDWLCDEVRLSERKFVLHEIEFRWGSHWIIECADIVCTWEPSSPGGQA